jgi:curved DNA-binding protein CbpA
LIDHYKILEISPSAKPDEIKRAYRSLSLKYHPDKNGGDRLMAEKFLAVKDAYELLSDESKRLIYDADYHNLNYNKSKERDPLFMDAAKIVMIYQSCSLSLLKLELGIKTERAKELIDELEKEGIVAPLKGPTRLVLLKKEEFEYKYNVVIPPNFRSSNIKDEDYIVRPANYKKEKKPIKIFKRIRQLIVLSALVFLVYHYWEPIKAEWDILYEEHLSEYFSSSSDKTGRVVAASGLKMRANPDVNSGLISVIPNNTEITILDTNGPEQSISGRTAKWFEIRYSGKTGWVWGGYIQEN